MNSIKNDPIKTNDFDEFLKKRMFEDSHPGFYEKIIAKSKESIELPNHGDFFPKWSLAVSASGSLAIFFLGLIIGFYGGPMVDYYEELSQYAQILNFLKPYGVVL